VHAAHLTVRSTRALGLTGAAVLASLALTACAPGSGAATSSTASSSATVKEYSPPGDIPDDQVFVPYSPPGADYSLEVPEGWSRSTEGGVVAFTDKLNSIKIQSGPAAAAPTVASATSQEVPQIEATAANYSAGDVTAVDRKAGKTVLITYEADSAPEPVTHKVVRDSVERYEFFHHGEEAVLTLSGPVGADNVDPWRIVSDSFTWK